MATVVNDAHLFSRERKIELSRLNEAERRVLRLLAEGHTAKSVANELGTTPAAVNERLREARRKTGVGSSRELARLLKAQENRHEQMGVGRGRSPATSSVEADAEPRRPQTGVLRMIALFIVAAAGAAALMTQRPQVESVVDPLVGTVPGGETEPARLYARIRAEQRDPTWAPVTEQALRARYSTIEHVGGPNNPLRIICETTLCEVAGTIDAPASKADEESLKTPLNRVMTALQGKALHDDLAKLGLENVSGFFGGGKAGRTVFLQYWSRKGAKPK